MSDAIAHTGVVTSAPTALHARLAQWAGNGRCDLLVVGGGATGLGVALQAALEGRDVALVEARDFASGTSSRSTKLLHGGVRYLAQGHLGLVREALRERATVMQLAPHLAQPLAFLVRTHGLLDRARMTIGLHAYDWLSGAQRIGPVQATADGLRYWDGQFEDARLALALARTAERAGARLRNHARLIGLHPDGEAWAARLFDDIDGTQVTLRAQAVVNAAGVWVDAVRNAALAAPGRQLAPVVRPSQGVHLVVAGALLPVDDAILVPKTSDGRVLFAVPWLGATLIGTTDTPRDDAPFEPQALHEELRFLIDEARHSLGVTVRPRDVLSVWAGLRPLVMPPSTDARNTGAISREHAILRDAPGLFTVTGGKWTTYRSMAASVIARMQRSGDLPAPPAGPCDTRTHRLVGAPPASTPPHSLGAPPGLHLWGTEADAVLALPGASHDLGGGLTEAMVRFAARKEWAVTVEDMLARRWRLLFLDARAALRLAPAVARLLEEETGIPSRLEEFQALCQRYVLPPE